MISILFGHEKTLWSESLAAILYREPDFRVIAEATTPEEILGVCESESPDVVVLALYLIDVSTVGALCRELSEGPSGLRVLVLHERDMPLAPFTDVFRLARQ